MTAVHVFLMDWNQRRPFGGDSLEPEVLEAFAAGRYAYAFSLRLRESESDIAAAEAAYQAQGNNPCARKVRVDRQTMSIADAVLVDGRAYVADHFGFARTPGLDGLLPKRIASSWLDWTHDTACDSSHALLERALPMLQRLGDFIGNGEVDSTRSGSLGSRCDLIGDIKNLLAGEA